MNITGTIPEATPGKPRITVVAAVPEGHSGRILLEQPPNL